MTGNNGIKYSGNLTKIIRGAGVNLSGSIFGRVILLIHTLLLARLLTTSELGLYFLGLTITYVLTMIGLMGLQSGVIRFVSIYSGKADLDSILGILVSALVITLVSSIFIALLLLAGRDWISRCIFVEPRLTNVLGIFVFAIPIDAMCKVFLATTQGLKYMQYTVYVEQIIMLVLRLIFVVLFVWLMNLGVEGAAMAYLLASILGLLAAFIFCNRKVPLIQKGRKPEFRTKELLHFSLPMIPASIIFNVSTQVDILMLGWLGTSSAVGIYSVSVRLIKLPMMVTKAFRAIFDPIIADLYCKRDFFQLSKLFNFSARWAFTISLPAYLALLCFPCSFMGLFGEKISTGAVSLSILASAYVFSTLSGLAASMIVMAGRSNLALINNLFFMFVSCTINYLLIPRYGVLGAATGHAAAFFALTALRFGEMFKTIKIHPFQLSLMKPVIASALSLSPLFIYFGINARLSSPVMLLSITVFILLYVAILLILRLDDHDRQIVSLFKSPAFRNSVSGCDE